MMHSADTRNLEALLFLHGDPVSIAEIAVWLELEEEQVLLIAEQLNEVLRSGHSALCVQIAGNSVALTTVAELDSWLREKMTLKISEPLSHAAWEVLSVVAYRQPITRMEIEALRQVGSERAIDTLVHRGLIEEVGRKETPGRPILYGTSHNFLLEFGLHDLNELPPLADFLGSPGIK